MARIRTIKPEFFTDEDVAALPLSDRLVYIGLWTQADKAGRLEDRPRRLKAMLLPYDDIDLDEILARLIEARFLLRYATEGGRYLQVRTWEKHQRPHHTEPESILPPPPPLLEEMERKGREVTLDKSKVVSPSSNGANTVSEPSSDTPATKVAAFVALWHEMTTPPICRCREVTTHRRTAILARLRDRSLEDWREVFARVEASAFCRGENDRGWRACIDWVLRPDTAAKVLEGMYDGTRAPAPAKVRRFDPKAWAEKVAQA